MRALLVVTLLLGCERAPQPEKQNQNQGSYVEPTRARHPAAVKREHIEAAEAMLTSLVYLDMDLSESHLVPDCTFAARHLELYLRNQHEQVERMARAITETDRAPAAKTWFALHYAERMHHAASALMQWAEQCAQEPAFRRAFARVPLL